MTRSPLFVLWAAALAAVPARPAAAQMTLKPLATLAAEAARTTCPSFAKGVEGAAQAPEVDNCVPIRVAPLGGHGGAAYWFGLYCVALKEPPGGGRPHECRGAETRQRGDGVAVMVERDGAFVVLFADANLDGGGGLYEAPRFATNRFGTVLDIPIALPGVAAMNGSVAFIAERDTWRALDTSSWQATLAAKLPKGMAVRRGLWPDYERLTARTPLWQARDALCCPTGGEAEIAFVIRNRTLVVDKVTVKTAPAKK
jgi:hypothetical protein